MAEVTGEKGQDSPSRKSIIVGTTEGYPYGTDTLLVRKDENPTFTNRYGAEIIQLDRFAFNSRSSLDGSQTSGVSNDSSESESANGEEESKVAPMDRARLSAKIEDIMQKKPDVVKLRYGGLTEVTMAAAMEFLLRGVEVQFERFNRETSQYEPYYSVDLPEDMFRFMTQRSSDEDQDLGLGTIKGRHEYPVEKVRNFLFSDIRREDEKSVDYGTIQRDFYPKEVKHFMFNFKDDPVETHHTGSEAVTVDVASAPGETEKRVHSYITELETAKQEGKVDSETNHINLYYSGLTEVTVITVFELVKAGYSVSLMGHVKDQDYQEGVYVPALKIESELINQGKSQRNN